MRSRTCRLSPKRNQCEQAVQLFGEHRPDITLMDLRMGTMSGVRAIEAVRTNTPTARIIVLTSYDRDEDVYQSLSCWSDGLSA